MAKKKTTGYYKPEIIAKFCAELGKAKEDIRAALANGEEVHVKFSYENSKMGAVPSVSLLPFLTCPAICATTCGAKCYAAKIANLRPAVRYSYAWNTVLAFDYPEIFWNDVDNMLKMSRYFRFHVSGDFAGAAYFAKAVEVIGNNPKCEVLAFTKQYDIVNAYMDENGGVLPTNFHLLFSGWGALEVPNKYNLPMSQVVFKGCEPLDDWKVCGGNCFNCACRGVGCWTLQKGETVCFNVH